MDHLSNTYDGTIHEFAIRYINPENGMFDDSDQVHIINYASGDEKVQTPAAFIQPELHVQTPNAEHYDRDI